MSAVYPESPLSSPVTAGLLPGASAGVVMTSETIPATATPGQADTLTISESTAERDQLAAKLAHALAANQRWAETLAGVQQRHTEVKRERDEAREQLATLRELAESWTRRAPEVRPVAMQFTMSPHDMVSSDCGREILAILDADDA